MILVLFEKNTLFDGKMGVAATLAPKGMEPQSPTKKWAHWVDLTGQLLSRKSVFKILGPDPLPLDNA